MLYRTPTPQFTTLIRNNIRYWQQSVAQPSRADYLDAERQNIYQSVNMGLQVAATMPTATDLLLELFPFIINHGYWRTWIPLLEKSIAAQPDTPKRWELQIKLAHFYRMIREDETAVSLLHTLLTKPIDISQRGRVYYHLGRSCFYLRQYENARHHAQHALAIIENNPEAISGGIAPILNLMGIINLHTGKNEAAIPLFKDAGQRWRHIEDYANMLSALLNEGLAYSNIGQQEAALRCYQEAIISLEVYGCLLDRCTIYLNIGTIYGRQGKWGKAKAAYLHVDRAALYQRGHLEYYARIITSLGMATMELGELETAVSHTTEAITIWQQLGDELMEANALENLGDTHLRMGNSAAAQASYQRGINLTSKHADDLFAQQLQQTLTEKARGLSQS